ncbi:MAG: hypothetical protein CMJ85_06385 [Planctomycetes bacterium]|nr:hypothetical protein [Planctomycetota bacterium]
MAFVVASIGAVVTSLVGVLVAPELSGGAAAALQRGCLIAGATALLVGVLVGVWTMRSCQRGGSSFLAPMAGGFLVKLVVLAGGTVLLAGPLAELGNHIAFAVCFALAAMAFQLLFTPALQRALNA